MSQAALHASPARP